MGTITVRPKWQWQTHPCPQCGQQSLVYDGSVKWSRGPRPGRELATKAPMGFSPRADFEIAHYFHCASCETPFVDAVDGHRPYLHPEQPAPRRGA